jgi:hypothetical protein
MGHKVYVKRLRSYNFHGYTQSYQNAESLVEQIYEEIDTDRTRMTFRSRLFDFDKLSHPVSRFTYFSWLTIGGFAVSKTEDIFRKNLVNIKADIEQGPNYKRIYPYEP